MKQIGLATIGFELVTKRTSAIGGEERSRPRTAGFHGRKKAFCVRGGADSASGCKCSRRRPAPRFLSRPNAPYRGKCGPANEAWQRRAQGVGTAAPRIPPGTWSAAAALSLDSGAWAARFSVETCPHCCATGATEIEKNI